MQVSSLSIDSLKLRIAEWRAERPSKGRHMPRNLWTDAVELSTQYGVQTIARELKLNPTKLGKLSRLTSLAVSLKERSRVVPHRLEAEKRPQLIEVAPLNLPPRVDYAPAMKNRSTAQPTMVVEKPNGARLTLYVPLEGEILTGLMREVVSCFR